jgi:hypothetical protein
VDARTRAGVAAVLGEEDADVVALGRACDERRLHVDDRRVADEGAGIDDPTGADLQARDLDVVRGAVVDAAGEVVDASLREDRRDAGDHDGNS